MCLCVYWGVWGWQVLVQVEHMCRLIILPVTASVYKRPRTAAAPAPSSLCSTHRSVDNATVIYTHTPSGKKANMQHTCQNYLRSVHVLKFKMENGDAFSHLCSLSLFELLLCRFLLGSVSSGRSRVQLWFVLTAGRLHGDKSPSQSTWKVQDKIPDMLSGHTFTDSKKT